MPALTTRASRLASMSERMAGVMGYFLSDDVDEEEEGLSLQMPMSKTLAEGSSLSFVSSTATAFSMSSQRTRLTFCRRRASQWNAVTARDNGDPRE